MRNAIFAAFFLALCPFVLAQQSINNDAVVKMAKAGLSDDVIITTINASPGTYDTTADGLIALKQAGVSDKVIAAVVSKRTTTPVPSVPLVAPQPPPSAPAITTAPPAANNLPPGVDSVGVYYLDNSGSWQEVNAEVVNFKTGGVVKHMASAGLIKGDLNGHVGGKRSQLALKAPAKFIFYVPEGRSPGEYQLLRLHVNSGYREFRSVTGGIVHVTGGAIRDDVEFSSKKIAPRAYEIVLNSDIGKGEYGFLPPLDTISEKNMASSGKIYTFAIVE